MNNLTTQLQITSALVNDYVLKVTSDGIQSIPLSFAGFPIDFFVSVGSECATLAHYTSGYLTDVTLKTHCVVLTNQYETSSTDFSVSTECLPFTGNFIKGTLTVFASALSGITYDNNSDDCSCSDDSVESWNRKYSKNSTIEVTGIFNVNGLVQTLTGTSNFFDIVPCDDFYQIKRKGEDITIVDKMQRLATDPKLLESDYWKFAHGLFGENITDLNYYINEKMSNFSENNTFVDTMNYRIIKKTKSIFGEEFQNFEIGNIPQEIERMVDIGSIETSKLFGTSCRCNMNFQSGANCNTDKCKLCLKGKSINNLGNLLSFDTILSAGNPIIYKSQFDEKFNIMYPTEQNGLSTYSLASLTAQNINERNDICFYEWDQTPQNNVIGNFLLLGDDVDNKTHLMKTDMEVWGDVMDETLLHDLQKIVEVL